MEVCTKDFNRNGPKSEITRTLNLSKVKIFFSFVSSCADKTDLGDLSEVDKPGRFNER
jgi:hypothetical protein